MKTLIEIPAQAVSSPAKQWRQWWQKQSPTRQDRFANLAPIAAVILFMAAIASAFWYLRGEELEREQEAVRRDVEYAQQRMRMRLLERQEQVMRVARDISNRELRKDQFAARVETLLQQSPEYQSLTWVDAQRQVQVSQSASSYLHSPIWRSGEALPSSGETPTHFGLARELMQPIYGVIEAETSQDGTPASAAMLQMHAPLTNSQGQFAGVVMAEYPLENLLRYGVPTEILAKYALSLLSADGQLLAGQTVPKRTSMWSDWDWIKPAGNEFQVPVSPVGNGLLLRAQAWRTSTGLVGNAQFWMAVALSVLTAWMLLANWRHSRRRQQAQKALVAETNFRRAMENSMLTGMRALDLQGRITYVNTAFCEMTGWSETELVGATAPFPYWPEQDLDLLKKRLEEELRGLQSPGGFQVRVKRKNGSLFDARMYVSPLIDAQGKHTGWMTSMTDITEPNRIREQLASAHERFTIVLEALDASVSVAPLGSTELLFANKLYRQWFDHTTQGHLLLVEQAGAYSGNGGKEEAAQDVDALAGLPTEPLTVEPSENTEIFVASLEKWLEVRSRYINWADGRLAQMVIATDITTRRKAEELAQQQAERAQTASRLITMGEMASSVAHELNQPLTAISNYCNGMISRIKNQQIQEQDLLWALDKTAHQAHRAGQVIQRIRSFVKRSEPNRTRSSVAAIVQEAVELAEIELRRSHVRLMHYVAARLPDLLVDPILIEQVLINLMKNAAESIENAQRPASRRLVELQVIPRSVQDQEVVEFSVTDSGKGLPPESMDRLYEAFFSTKAEGMGIGLNLCRSIIESHAGRIEAQNLYNAAEIVGCRFSFWIPVHNTASPEKIPEVSP